MNVLYSLISIDNERLDLVARKKTFSNTLNFISINDSIFDRFCIYILPRIHYNVKCLILESLTMERIPLTVDYPNLTELKISKFNQDFALRYCTRN